MTLFIDGLAILNTYKAGIFLFIFSAFGLGCWISPSLKTRQEQPGWMNLAGSILLGALVLAWLSFVLVLLKQLWSPLFEVGTYLIPAASAILLLLTIKKKGIGRASRPDLMLGGLLCCSLLLFLLTRLAFLHDILLPPYNDSPKHYKIVQGFLHPSTNNISFYSPINTASHFYHFGFHSLAAWLSAASRMDPAASIAVLGQVLAALAPFSILWLTYAVTRSSRAGWAAALFAAFAWQMPYFALNWGKYPAIAGLSLIPAVLAFWAVYGREEIKHWSNLLVMALLATGLVLLHTRLLICLGLAGGIYFLVDKFFWKRALQPLEVCALWIPALGIFFLFRGPLQALYSIGHLIGFMAGALLMFFAFQAFPRFSAGISLFVLGVWVASKITIPFQGHHLLLLDPIFVETMLYIPLALFIGLGFAGLSGKLTHHAAAQVFLAISMGAMVLASMLSSNTFRPDPCCNYVKRADVDAIHWIGGSTQAKAVVWIAAFQAKNFMIGTDAGIWVNPLTGRNTNKLAYDFDWNSPSAPGAICKPGYQDVYIYKGGMPYSFNQAQLAKQNWLRVIFEENGTAIYNVACGVQ